jgi:hypothetical protein
VEISRFSVTHRTDFYLVAFQSPGVLLRPFPSTAGLRSGVKQQTASATRRLQSFVGEFDRLSSLTMAAGKDFNDELTFILNHAEVSLDLLGPEHPASDGLVELTHAAMRCAETTRCLLLLTERARESVRYAKVRAGHANSGNRELL